MSSLDDSIRAAQQAITAVFQSARQDDKTVLQNALAMNEVISEPASFCTDPVIIFGDINNFKSVNDEHTYQAGDAAIGRAGQVLKMALEPYRALAFRQSGDEFLIVASAAHLTQIQEALSNSFKRLDVSFNGKIVSVGMSFGVARVDPEVSIQETKDRAEAACKAAKLHGNGTVREWNSELAADIYEFRGRCDCGCESKGKMKRSAAIARGHWVCPGCDRPQPLHLG